MMVLVPLAGFLLTAMALHLTTRHIAAGKVGINPAIGIRTKHTMASDAAWQAGHQAALPHLRATYWVCYLTAVGFLPLGLLAEPDPWIGGLSLVACALLLSIVLLGAKVANRAAQTASNR